MDISTVKKSLLRTTTSHIVPSIGDKCSDMLSYTFPTQVYHFEIIIKFFKSYDNVLKLSRCQTLAFIFQETKFFIPVH